MSSKFADPNPGNNSLHKPAELPQYTPVECGGTLTGSGGSGGSGSGNSGSTGTLGASQSPTAEATATPAATQTPVPTLATVVVTDPPLLSTVADSADGLPVGLLTGAGGALVAALCAATGVWWWRRRRPAVAPAGAEPPSTLDEPTP